MCWNHPNLSYFDLRFIKKLKTDWAYKVREQTYFLRILSINAVGDVYCFKMSNWHDLCSMKILLEVPLYILSVLPEYKCMIRKNIPRDISNFLLLSSHIINFLLRDILLCSNQNLSFDSNSPLFIRIFRFQH